MMLCIQKKADVFRCDNMHTSPLIGAFFAGTPIRIWFKRAMNADYEQCRKPTVMDRIAITTRLSVACATSCVAVSGAVAKELYAMGISRRKIIVHNNPRPDFLPSGNRIKAREEFGCADSDTVLLTIGRSAPVKGWDVLTDAFCSICERNDSLRVLFVGSTDAADEKQLHSYITGKLKWHGIEDKAIFTGHRGDIVSVLAAADMFVMPSRSEGFCVALVEALTARLPCISTRVGIAEQVISDGENGFLVPQNNAGALSLAIGKLAENPRLRQKFAERISFPDSIPPYGDYAVATERLYSTLLERKVQR
jgi:glycosyltransferase involved in cell wall biosynthesis